VNSSGSVAAKKVTRAKLVTEQDGQAKTGKLRRGSKRKKARAKLSQDVTSASEISGSCLTLQSDLSKKRRLHPG